MGKPNWKNPVQVTQEELDEFWPKVLLAIAISGPQAVMDSLPDDNPLAEDISTAIALTFNID